MVSNIRSSGSGDCSGGALLKDDEHMGYKYTYTLGVRTWHFRDLADLLAKATPARSGDRLAGVIAESAEERVVAQMRLAELPLREFLSEVLVPYEQDEVTRLILDTHDSDAFAPVAHLTVGDLSLIHI